MLLFHKSDDWYQNRVTFFIGDVSTISIRERFQSVVMIINIPGSSQDRLKSCRIFLFHISNILNPVFPMQYITNSRICASGYSCFKPFAYPSIWIVSSFLILKSSSFSFIRENSVFERYLNSITHRSPANRS